MADLSADEQAAADQAAAEKAAAEKAAADKAAAERDGDLPDKVKEVLAKERTAAREADKRARDAEARMKELEDRDKSEAQKIQEERDALRTERDQLAHQSLRRDVAEDKGLTPAQAKRLTGTTREEMETDADDLLATFPPARPTFGNVGQGNRDQGTPRVYKQSELNNHKFFMDNKADILAAQKEGRITAD